MTTSPTTRAARRPVRRYRALAVTGLLLPLLSLSGAAAGTAFADVTPAPVVATAAPVVATAAPEPVAEPPAPEVVAEPVAEAVAAPPAGPVDAAPPAAPPADATQVVTDGTPPADAPVATTVAVHPAPPAPAEAPVEGAPADEQPANAAAAPAGDGGEVAGASLAAATASRLGSADAFAVLAGSTITNTGRSVVKGDVGLHPGTAVTGFAPCTGAANCVELTGTMHITDGVAQDAKADLLTAYDTLVGLESTCTPLNVELGGSTLTPGVYCSPTFGLTGTLTLSGVGEFIFLTGAGGSALTTAAGSQVLLVDGADSCNLYWQIASSATIGAGSAFAGNILARTSISFGTGATLNGSALALDGAVTMISNTITDTRCAGTPPDGGGTPPDDGGGGTPPDDGGTPPDDGGTPPDDGGTPPDDDGGTPPDDGGTPPDDGGTLPDEEGEIPGSGVGTPVEDDEGNDPGAQGSFPPLIHTGTAGSAGSGSNAAVLAGALGGGEATRTRSAREGSLAVTGAALDAQAVTGALTLAVGVVLLLVPGGRRRSARRAPRRRRVVTA